ncbi:MAG: hypothetical protein COA39_003405 [Sulfurimonas sp.]|nr:hypothetical protein [Sulfurimonas sp.]
MEYKDTYFFNGQVALQAASEQNRYGALKQFLQVCYYDGEKIQSDLINLIHLPIGNLVDGLGMGTARLPTGLNLGGLEVSEDVRMKIIENFRISLRKAYEKRNEFNSSYYEVSKNTELNFNESLRFYLVANKSTQVMQYISYNVTKALKAAGYNVFYDLNYGIEDENCLKNMSQFNPHVTININHLNNDFLSPDVYNFVWFQDFMPILLDKKKMKLRKRDFIFHLTDGLEKKLHAKKVFSRYQGFCIDTSTYKPNKSIKKEKKIVFIGSSYMKNFQNIQADQKDFICDLIYQAYLKDGIMPSKKRRKIAKKFKIDEVSLGHIFNYVERDLALLYIVQNMKEYEIEVYGPGWDTYEVMHTIYKGSLSYGEEISRVYNSAMYSLVLGGYVLQQRTLESAASGCIPIVVDSRINDTMVQECYEESLIFIKTADDLQNVLDEEPNRELECIVKYNSYDKFVQTMRGLIK